MKIKGILVILIAIFISGCSNNKIICSGSELNTSYGMNIKVYATLKSNKINSLKAIMNFSSEEKYKELCSFLEKFNSIKEDKIDYKCENNKIEINNYDLIINLDGKNIKELTKKEFKEIMKIENLSCK